MVEFNGTTVSEFLDDFTDALRQSRYFLKYLVQYQHGAEIFLSTGKALSWANMKIHLFSMMGDLYFDVISSVFLDILFHSK
jgi:hypothetical protein